MLHGRSGSIDLAPEVDVHLAPHVFDGELSDAAVHRDRRVVHPCVDAPERAQRRFGDRLDLMRVRDVGSDVDGPPAVLTNLFNRLRQLVAVP